MASHYGPRPQWAGSDPLGSRNDGLSGDQQVTDPLSGVTAALRVNASVHNPLLCVVDVFKVASGDLSLPGKVNQ
jgi:hypothetical protein